MKQTNLRSFGNYRKPRIPCSSQGTGRTQEIVEAWGSAVHPMALLPWARVLPTRLPIPNPVLSCHCVSLLFLLVLPLASFACAVPLTWPPEALLSSLGDTSSQAGVSGAALCYVLSLSVPPCGLVSYIWMQLPQTKSVRGGCHSLFSLGALSEPVLNE